MEDSWKRLAQIQMLKIQLKNAGLGSRYSDCQCGALTPDFTSWTQQDTAFPLGHGVDLLSSILSLIFSQHSKCKTVKKHEWGLASMPASLLITKQKYWKRFPMLIASCKPFQIMLILKSHLVFLSLKFAQKIMQCTSVSKLGEGQICCWISDSRKEEDIGLNCCVALYVFPAYCTFWCNLLYPIRFKPHELFQYTPWGYRKTI